LKQHFDWRRGLRPCSDASSIPASGTVHLVGRLLHGLFTLKRTKLHLYDYVQLSEARQRSVTRHCVRASCSFIPLRSLQFCSFISQVNLARRQRIDLCGLRVKLPPEL